MLFVPYLNPTSYLQTDLIEPGLSDYHASLTTVKKTHFEKYKPIQNLNQASSLMEATNPENKKVMENLKLKLKIITLKKQKQLLKGNYF